MNLSLPWTNETVLNTKVSLLWRYSSTVLLAPSITVLVKAWVLQYSSSQSTWPPSFIIQGPRPAHLQASLYLPVNAVPMCNLSISLFNQPITSRLNRQMTNNITRSSTNQDNDQRLITSTDDSQFTWLWWWLPLRLSRCQSMSPQTVLLRTTLTRTITIYRIMIWLLGLNRLQFYFFIFDFFRYARASVHTGSYAPEFFFQQKSFILIRWKHFSWIWVIQLFQLTLSENLSY